MAQTFVTRPIITEKSMTQAQKGWYAFAVGAHARKELIAKEIGRLYNVTVRQVRTIHKKGKVHRAGKKMNVVTRTDWKKALVKLAKGQRISIFEVGETENKKA
jgi:large subunit ribosomal protein L23